MNEPSTQSVQLQPSDPMPQLRRILSARPELPLTAVLDPSIEAMVAPWAEDGAVCPPARLQAAGDAVLTISGPAGVGASDASAILRTILAGLVLEGVVRSARRCGAGGLMVAVVECLDRAVGGAVTPESLGVVLQWVPSPGSLVGLDEELFGEKPNRVLITVRGEDAGRVVKQARILGANGARVGTVSESGVTVRFGESEWVLSGADLAGGGKTRSS